MNFTRTKFFEEYKLLRNTINELIKKSKKSYYQSFFAEYNTNIKKVWEGIKKLVNIKKKNISTPTSIEIKVVPQIQNLYVTALITILLILLMTY